MLLIRQEVVGCSLMGLLLVLTISAPATAPARCHPLHSTTSQAGNLQEGKLQGVTIRKISTAGYLENIPVLSREQNEHHVKRTASMSTRAEATMKPASEVPCHADTAAMEQNVAPKDERLYEERHTFVEINAMKTKAMLLCTGYRRGKKSSDKGKVRKRMILERQKEMIWAEMRGPKYRVNNTRPFHTDYAEALPHPPQSN